MIDLRSDTVTKPTPSMKEAMFQAIVGDDVFEEDPTIAELEQTTAAIFGMEAGLFCPSGTMTNQIAIKAHTQPQDQVICDEKSHIYLYEGGGVAANSLVSCRLLKGDRGRIKATDVLQNINDPDDVHLPQTRLVSLENTMNKGGGSCYELESMQEIGLACQEHGLQLHLDGARVFNALVATGQDAKQYGTIFDSISVCLSKGLGAPVGSVLLGNASFIKKARRIRKMMGGGMRQAGYLAAAGLYALEHHVARLEEDHQKAKYLEEVLIDQPYVKEVMPVSTNIVIFELAAPYQPKSFLDLLAQKGILAVPFGRKHIRFVTHLDISQEQIETMATILRNIRNQS